MRKEESKESFIWHEVNEEERKSIKEEAKKIMDNFGKELEKLGEGDFIFVERDNSLREEKDGGFYDKDFQGIMFDNAPKKSRDSIIAEKGEWV